MKRHLSEQLPLVFGHAPATGRDDLLVSDRLSAAISIVDHWPAWPSPVVIICGPVGSGKSHLAGIWREKARAEPIHPFAGSNAADIAAEKPVLFEDATGRASTMRLSSMSSTACARTARRF